MIGRLVVVEHAHTGASPKEWMPCPSQSRRKKETDKHIRQNLGGFIKLPLISGA